MSRVAVTLLAFLCVTTTFAQPAVDPDRAQAFEGLRDADATHRAAAVIWIAHHGDPADDEALRRRLSDDNPQVRALAEQGLWILWGRSGDEAVDELMNKGAAQTRAGELDDAIATYSEVIRRKPAFAEGWNKRATVRYLSGDFRRSLADCDEVMKRNPHHFGALAGYGQIYLELEQYEKAIGYWKRALAANPNMSGVEANIEIVEKLIARRRANAV
ncbi:MAG: tetratricopeptide repeat protein [Betaproteobacteria bacterium]